jgi:tripartite ATP-independent transporter DctM subunit
MEFLQIVVLLGLMFFFMGLGLPVFLAMGFSCLIFTVIFDVPIMILAQSYVRGLGSYEFLAIPFYFLAGDLMNAGGITSRLLKFSSAAIGHLRGGLSHVNIVASMIFSGVSGSAVADTSAIGSILIPSMKKEGYSAAYSAAVTAASSTIGPVIPPSIPVVVYGLLAGVSIGKLFLAGAIPGILMGVYLLVVSFIVSYRRNYPANPRVKFKQLLHSSLDASLAIIMPIIIICGITTGIVTPTEAGAIAVAYGLLLGVFVYRELKVKDLPKILSQTMVNCSAVLIIIATTGLFSWIIANMGLGDALVRLFMSISTSKWIILTVLMIFFLIWGLVLDAVSAMVIMVPIFVPLVEKLGIDLVHFGILVVINLMIGLITPPVGILLYLATSIAETQIEKVMKEMVPFIVALILVLIICTFIPGIVLWLPGLLIK